MVTDLQDPTVFFKYFSWLQSQGYVSAFDFNENGPPDLAMSRHYLRRFNHENFPSMYYLIIMIRFVISGVEGDSIHTTYNFRLEIQIADILLDSASTEYPNQMTMPSGNAAAVVTEQHFLPGLLSPSSTLVTGSYALRAIDLNSGVEAGATQVTLATLSVQAAGSGTA